ncbi:DUF4020 domain-containing protein [Asanoa iriomotensis]|uniref:SIR2-like domain-containing protein n=1 Tax=Asanoa iriomotensis TaxID=234613 RepID=A0ABQ4C1M5_9ACTN|nr:hypothetical protein Air01nite_27620 [Asanoa iriomotensis]
MPAALVSEFRAGNVVLFVGAGASIDPPAGLPTFVGLTKKIATDARHDFVALDLDHPDILLGRIEDRGVDVHHVIKTIIGDPASVPNDLHRAIAGLAAAGSPVRIVTTNYDLHLSSALRDLNVAFPEYRGPAVPMGDDFDGIVYLHGDLTQQPRHLIATEGDLGRAYLTDAWAARFVERMFARYTVLFIGYSHNDTVMRLIARGIGGATQRRYALTHEADRDVWKTYGVLPINYEVVDRSHAALADTLNGWAELTAMGLHDHRQRIARLVAAPPPLVPEQISYLEDVLGDLHRVRFFAELAEGTEWLSWTAQRPQFAAMFRADIPHDPCTVVLANWFVERFVMDEAQTGAALRVLHDGGGRPTSMLCGFLGQHLHRISGPRPGWLGPWLAVLIQHAGEEHTRWLEYALLKSAEPEDRAAALLLFASLTEPRLRQRLYAGPDPSFDVSLRGSVHHLDRAWAEVFLPILPTAATALLAIADRQLRRICDLLTIARAARPASDPVSFGRYAIERDAGDEFRNPVDALIDAARDCIEVLLASGRPSGLGYLDTWAISGVPILQRLALHGWGRRIDIDATAKLAWLRTTGWLFEHQLRPEIYRLIAETLANAGAAEAERLVFDAKTLPVRGRDAEHIAYLRFNALTWLVRSAPNLTSARTALDELRAAYPHFQPREHPDLFRGRFEFGSVPEQPPMTVDELHQRIAADPPAAIAELRQYEHVQVPFDGPGWDDALHTLTATIHDHPADGLAVLAHAEPLPTDIISAVISGWSSAPLDEATAVAVVHRIRDLDLEVVTQSVARLLLGGSTNSANATKWHLISEARELAEALWTVLGPEDPPDDRSDWLSLAINRPAGQIAEFWIRAVSADWANAGDAWNGLPSGLRRPLETMLGGPDGPTSLAQTVLAGHLAFFFAADRGWCEEFLLPLMTWAGDEDRAVRAWTGYLTGGRINDDLCEAGLRSAYLETVAHADRLPDDLGRALLEHLAAIAIHSATDPLTWVDAFTAAADEQQRTEWLGEITQAVGNLVPDAVEQQWHRWMQQYWKHRLNSLPTRLTFEEASALATWVPRLTDSMEAGVELATAHQAGLTERHTLDDWTDERLAQAPGLFARLLAHLLTGTTGPVWEDIERVALTVKGGAAPAVFSVIRDQALRLAVSGAADW